MSGSEPDDKAAEGDVEDGVGDGFAQDGVVGPFHVAGRCGEIILPPVAPAELAAASQSDS